MLVNLFVIFMLFDAAAQSISANYGTVADNLPPATDVITLYTTNGIRKMRIFDPNQASPKRIQHRGHCWSC